MAFSTPTLATLQDRIAGDLTTRLRAAGYTSDARIRFTLPWVVSWTLAMVSWSLHQAIASLAKQALASTATTEDAILGHAGEWGVDRIPASKASGSVVFMGTATTAIADGTEVQDSAGTSWVTVGASAIGGGGTVTVPVEASEAGDAGNVVAGTILTLTGTIAGVDAQATVATGGISGGADTETLERLKGRTVELISSSGRPQGGAAPDYTKWAKAASASVSRVFTLPHYPIPGDVAVWVMGADPADSLPGSGVVSAVQAYIDDGRAPVTATVTVAAPTADTIAMTINLTPNGDGDVEAAVEAELRSLFHRSANPAAVTTIANSNIRAAISAAEGEVSHALTSVDGDGTGTSDITTAVGVVPILGTVTFS